MIQNLLLAVDAKNDKTMLCMGKPVYGILHVREQAVVTIKRLLNENFLDEKAKLYKMHKDG